MILFGSDSMEFDQAIGQYLGASSVSAKRMTGDWVPFGKTPVWYFDHVWPRFSESMDECSGVLWIAGRGPAFQVGLLRLYVLRWAAFCRLERIIPVVVMSQFPEHEPMVSAHGMYWSLPLIQNGLNSISSVRDGQTNFVSPNIEKAMGIEEIYFVALKQALHHIKDGNFVSGEFLSQNAAGLGGFFRCISQHFKQMTNRGTWGDRMIVACEEAEMITDGIGFPEVASKRAGGSQSLKDHINKWKALNSEANRQYDRYLMFIKGIGKNNQEASL